MLEPLIGGCYLSDSLDGFMPKYGLGGVSNVARGVADASPTRRCSASSAAGLLLALYALIFCAIGLLVMRRRDVTA